MVFSLAFGFKTNNQTKILNIFGFKIKYQTKKPKFWVNIDSQIKRLKWYLSIQTRRIEVSRVKD